MAQSDHIDRRDRKRIRRQMVAAADRVEYAIRFAIHALLVGDARLANEIALECQHIELALQSLNQRCLDIADHQPLFAASALRLSEALAEARAQAEGIARDVPRCHTPQPALARELELLAERSRLLLELAIRTWSEGDIGRARDTLDAASQVDSALTAASQELLEWGLHGVPPAPPTRSTVNALFGVFRKVGENARQFCEETIGTAKLPSLLTGTSAPSV